MGNAGISLERRKRRDLEDEPGQSGPETGRVRGGEGREEEVWGEMTGIGGGEHLRVGKVETSAMETPQDL